MCCIQETRIQNCHPISAPFQSFTEVPLQLSQDSEVASSCLTGVYMALSGRAEASLLDRISVNSRPYALRLKSSSVVSNHCSGRIRFSVVPAYTPRDCSPAAFRNNFYRKHSLVEYHRNLDRKRECWCWSTVIERGAFGSSFEFDSLRSEDEKRLIAICLDRCVSRA